MGEGRDNPITCHGGDGHKLKCLVDFTCDNLTWDVAPDVFLFFFLFVSLTI